MWLAGCMGSVEITRASGPEAVELPFWRASSMLMLAEVVLRLDVVPLESSSSSASLALRFFTGGDIVMLFGPSLRSVGLILRQLLLRSLDR